MQLVDALREYLGWCPDRRMTPVGKRTLWRETNSHTLPTGGAYANDGVIVDYGATGVSLPFFLGTVIGVIGIVALLAHVIPFALFRVVSANLLCGLILPVAIVTLYRDIKKATLEISRDALVIRRFLHRPVVIRKEAIAAVEIRDNVPPVPIWLQTVLFLFVIPASSAYIIYSEYLQFVTGEITSSSIFLYLGFYPSIILLFLVSYYHSRIRSYYPKLLVITATTKKLAGIYGKNIEEIAGMLGKSV